MLLVPVGHPVLLLGRGRGVPPAPRVTALNAERPLRLPQQHFGLGRLSGGVLVERARADDVGLGV